MTECGGGSFCKEDFQNLEIPECLKEWVQLAGLVEGSKIMEDLDGTDQIMRGAAIAANVQGLLQHGLCSWKPPGSITAGNVAKAIVEV